MDERLPLVSIVTPSYNQARFLPDTIDSVLNQTYPNIEYIVIDGGSTDGSVELLENYADRIDYWVSEPDKGQTDAINKGFAQANGEILAWLNSDDTYQPEAVADAVRLMQQYPEYGLVYGEANFIDQHGNEIGRFPAAQTSYDQLRRGYVHVPQQSSFWRADLMKQVGALDDSLYFAMDYDLWLRLAEISRIKYFPGRVWANFRLHGESKTIAEDDRCWVEMVQIHRRDGGRWVSVLTIKYILRKLLAPLVTWRRRRRVQMAQEKD